MVRAGELEPGLPKSRIEALSDGIFAVAMTLLVLDIRVPSVTDSVQLPRALLALWPRCLTYAITFLMLGIYWVGQHNQFHLIRRTDRTLLWINICFLMTICFVPFSTALLSGYPRERLALSVYGGNLIAVGLILSAHWAYATHRGRLVDPDLDGHLVRAAHRRILIGPAVFALAIGAGYFSAALSLLLYALAPLVYLLPGRVDRHWSVRPHP
jgi:uncharacterized membrane protein